MTHYALLGGGRLARHMRHYLSLLGLSHSVWARNPAPELNSYSHRDNGERLRATVKPATHVLLLVSDGAIAGVLRQYPALRQKKLVHCSGALSIPGVAGAHPLMTFGARLYTREAYERIPFMFDSGHCLAEFLPGLPNPGFPIALENKARYHALCVMAGNFSQVLWHTVTRRFESLGLPADTLAPYLQQAVVNFTQDPDTALTGPLIRGDWQTVDRNLNSLDGDSLGALYRAFLDHWDAEGRGDLAQEAAS